MAKEGTPFIDLLDAMSRSTASGELPELKAPFRWIATQPVPKRRGRPRGTGHPKITRHKSLPLSDLDVTKLKRAGLSDEDVKYLYRWVAKGTFVAVAKYFGVTPQAVNKRFHKKFFPR